MTVLQDMVVRIRADASGVATGVAQAKEELAGVGAAATESAGGMKGFLGSVLGVAGGMAAMMVATKAFDFIKDQVTETITAGEEFQKSQAQTVQVLKSTGDASGMTAAGVEDLADSLSKVTPISAETTQSAENMLLTFTNIGKNVFPQATQTALDMAQALGGDAKQQALQLGIALNDPEKGIGRLTRVGVTFTQAQKDQIKAMEGAGNMAGAQAVVLKELQREFGGSAQAAGKTFAGSLAIASNQMQVAREKIAMALLPALQSIMSAVAPLITALMSDLPPAIDFLTQHAAQMKVVAAALAVTLAVAVLPALVALLAPLAGIALSAVIAAAPFILLGLAIAGVALYFQHLYETSVPFRMAVNFLTAQLKQLAAVLIDNIQAGFALLMPQLQAAWTWINANLMPALAALQPYIIQATMAVMQFASELSVRLGPAIHTIFEFISAALTVLGKLWVAVWPYLSVVLEGVWDVIKGVIMVAWSLVSGIIKVGLDLLGGNWKQAWTDMKAMFSGVWAGIESILSGAVNILKGSLGGLLDFGKSIVQNIINGIKGMAGALASAAKSTIGDAISNIPLVGKLLPHFAGGGVMAAAGLAVVGENGPELVQLPSGAQVYSNSTSAGMIGSGGGAALATSAAGGSGGAYNAANIYLMLDGRVMAQVMGQPLVDTIRARMGMKI